MSYDLFLKPGATPLSKDQFESYFSERPHFTVNNGQAFYENKDTGVYFSFDYESGDEEDSVAFNLNYFRPHFFGLEAAPVVAAFISSFNLSVDDPQYDGMGDGPFSIEGFLRGWNAGNRFGYRAMLSRNDRSEIHVYPTDDLERVWRWNFNRAAMQNIVGDSLFVPRFMFMKGATMARTAIVWPDACPIYMPKADLVIVIRDELSTTPTADDPREVTVVEWAEVESIVNDYPYDEEHGHFRLEYDLVPSAVVEFVQSLPLVSHDRDMGLACDSILNVELVAEATKTEQ